MPKPLLFVLLFGYLWFLRSTNVALTFWTLGFGVILALAADGIWQIHHQRALERAKRVRVVRSTDPVALLAVSARATSAGRHGRAPSHIDGAAQPPRSRSHPMPSAAIDFDAVEALRSLGFSKPTAVALLLASASSELTNTEQRVTSALRATAAPSLQPEARRS